MEGRKISACEIMDFSENLRNTKGFSPKLRKLFARTFYEIEKDVVKLVDIVGHISIDTTGIYI